MQKTIENIISDLKDTISVGKIPVSKYQTIGHEMQVHYYGGRLRRTRKALRVSRDLLGTPMYAKVKQVQVKVTRSALIDRNKYSGADLRRLRQERGVGRPPAHRAVA